MLAPVVAPGADLAMRVVEHGVPEALPAGGTVVLQITAENAGTTSWDPGDGYAVAAHLMDADGGDIRWDGPRTALPAVVPPGGAVTIDAVVDLPRRTGPVELQWDIVQEGVRWLSRVAEEPPPRHPVLLVERHAFVVETAAVPRWPLEGGRVTVPVTVRNTGATTWQPGGSFGIAAHWRRVDGEGSVWEGPRTAPSTVVTTGDTARFEASLDIPSTPGRWLLQWDMVEEGVCWFSQVQLSPPPETVVVVLPRGAAAWPSWIAAMAVMLLVVGGRRGWWSPRAARQADLVWLALLPWLAFAAVTEQTAAGLILSAALLVSLAVISGGALGRWRPLVSAFVGTVLVLVAVADRVYLRFFGDLPSLGSLGAAGQAGRLGESVLHLLDPADLGLLAVLPTAWAAAAMVAAMAGDRSRWGWRAVLPAVVVLLAAVTVAGSTDAARQVFRRVWVARAVGVPASHLLDLQGRAASAVRPPLSTARRAELVQWFEDRRALRAGTGPFFAAARGMNVVMVEAESLQHFVVGLEVGGEEVTPTINRWAGNGLWFDRITDQTGHGRSSDAELLTQTSLLPLVDGAAAFEHAGNGFTSLAGELASSGYATLSAVPFDRTFWNRARTHAAYGYEERLFDGDFEPGETVGWGLNDRAFLQQAAERAAALPEPFIAWFLTLSLHHPFTGFPDHLQELGVGAWEGGPVGEYLHTVRLLDHALADLERTLANHGLLERTLVVVWGDHDAGFRWRPEVAALMGVSPDSAGWYRSQRVPLVIRTPASLDLVARVSTPGGHVDVAPTLAALLGLDPAERAWMGRNLLLDGVSSVEPVVGEYACWMTDDLLFLQGETGFDTGTCLQLADLAPLDRSRCAEADGLARQRTAISRTVLDHDLQRWLTGQLTAPGHP
jgi:lipoteichoic acid synthase